VPEINCLCCNSINNKVVYSLRSRLSAPGQKTAYNISEDSFEIKDSRVVRCLKCGFIYLDPKPDLNLLSKAYENMQDDLYLKEEASRSKAAYLLLKKISRYKKKGRILDVGCATGILLNAAGQLGWEVHGVELSSWGVSLAKERYGINIFQGFLKDARFPGNYFDLVVMADSIEHFPDPRESLKEAARILKSDGLICISTPDAGSITSKIMGKSWQGIKESHLFYFNKNTISRMLNDSGFRILAFSTHARFFSINYLLFKFMQLFRMNNAKPSFIQIPLLGSLVLKIDLGDQLEVYAGKKAIS